MIDSPYFPGPPCNPVNVFNFTDSDVLVTNQSALCLACLFNGQGPQPGTAWLQNGQDTSSPSLSNIAQVNDNGTLVIVRPLVFNCQLTLTCQHGGSVFNITVKGELNIVTHCGWLTNYFVSSLTPIPYYHQPIYFRHLQVRVNGVVVD